MNAQLVNQSRASVLCVRLEADEAVETQGAILVGKSGPVREEAPELWAGALLWRERLQDYLLPRRLYRAAGRSATTLWLAAQVPGAIRELCAAENGLLLRSRAVFCKAPTLKLAVAQNAALGEEWLTLGAGGGLWLATYGALVEERVAGKLWVREERLVALEPGLDLCNEESAAAPQAGLRLVRGSGRIWLSTWTRSDFSTWFVASR